MSVRFAAHRSWPELVFHVLAHVRGTAHLPASVYDATYVRFVAENAPRSEGRTLDEDAELLARALPDHAALSRAQLVALLFDDVEQATASASTDLSDLPLGDALAPIAGAAELLRCAALLEEPTLAGLPPVVRDEDTLGRALGEVVAASPTLPRYTLLPLRALRLRGRLIGEEIWVGVPSSALALTAEHVAWQAAHEATVGEVAEHARQAEERAVEHAAVVLLAERAHARGLGEHHRRWLAHFGEVPEARRDALSPGLSRLLDELRSSDDGA